MKRVWGHVLVGGLVLGVGSIVMVACKSNDSTLFVQDVLAPPLVTPGQACVYTSDPTQAIIPSGTLDVALRPQYDPWYLLGNQAVAEVNSQQLATETNTITIAGATVRITDVSGNQLANYTINAAATLYPSSGGVPGYAPISLTTVDQATITGNAALQSNILAGGTTRLLTYVQFFGQSLGGRSIKSDTFEFPVDVCYGCLITFTENPLFNGPTCASSSTSSSSSLPEPCTIGQDDPVPCTACLELAVCRGEGSVTATDAGTD